MKHRIFAIAMAMTLSLTLLAGCGPKETPQKDVDLNAFAQDIMDKNEFGMLELLDPADEVSAGILDGLYVGLTDVETKQMYIYATMITMNNGEFALVEVANAEDAETVKGIFQARIDGMVNGGAFYPGPTEQWTNNSRVASNGNYVMMIVHENCDDIVEQFNALFA